jgi:hypothetical protein
VRVYDIRDCDGMLYAFEVPNTFLGRRGALRVIERVPGASVIRFRRLFQGGWDNDEVFCEFVVGGFMFCALEPFGDNSRYWIGPASSKRGPAIEAVRDEFERSRYLYGLPGKR